MTEKIDLKATVDGYRATRGAFRVVELPAMRYLMIDGHGDPNTSDDYVAAVQTLYPVAYALKFASKRQLARDYVVPPLEGLWWADQMDAFTTARDKTQWHWTMMLLVPEWMDQAMIEVAIEAAKGKGAPRIDDLRVESLTEGLCVQTLHIGSFDEEGPVLRAMHEEFIPDQGLALRGRHHEIYLSDPRRTAPEKLRTILRQPVIRVADPGDPPPADA